MKETKSDIFRRQYSTQNTLTMLSNNAFQRCAHYVRVAIAEKVML